MNTDFATCPKKADKGLDMNTRKKKVREASVLAGELLAALTFIGEHPDAGDTVRADMREIVRRACANPVLSALIGFSVMGEYERATGRTVKPSEDGAPELKVFGALVETITARLDAADARARGDSLH